jgi:RNA polymerase sigma-70 factor, ECF subfamily
MGTISGLGHPVATVVGQAGSRARAVSRALRGLTPSHRQVLNETILSNRTVGEAAEVLGIPVSTVKSRVYHALRALRLALAEQGVPL